MGLVRSMDSQVDRVVNVIWRRVHRSVSGMLDKESRNNGRSWSRSVGRALGGLCLIKSPGACIGRVKVCCQRAVLC